MFFPLENWNPELIASFQNFTFSFFLFCFCFDAHHMWKNGNNFSFASRLCFKNFFHLLKNFLFLFYVFFCWRARQQGDRCIFHIFPGNSSWLVVSIEKCFSVLPIIQPSTSCYSRVSPQPPKKSSVWILPTHLLSHHSFLKPRLGEVS